MNWREASRGSSLCLPRACLTRVCRPHLYLLHLHLTSQIQTVTYPDCRVRTISPAPLRGALIQSTNADQVSNPIHGCIFKLRVSCFASWFKSEDPNQRQSLVVQFFPLNVLPCCLDSLSSYHIKHHALIHSSWRIPAQHEPPGFH